MAKADCHYCKAEFTYDEVKLFNRLVTHTSHVRCPKCRRRYYVTADITLRLILKAEGMIREREYPLSIVISAMAIESYLFILLYRLNFLRKMKKGPGGVHYGNMADFPKVLEITENEMHRNRDIKGLLNRISLALVGVKFNDFIKVGLSNIIIQLTDNIIHKGIFWKRNSVLHHGNTAYTQRDAKRCLRIAIASVQALKEMESKKQESEFLPSFNPPWKQARKYK